jgi:hypothetical protein
MVDKTLAQLITMVQTELYQVSGAGTQVYGEANIAQKIQSSFDLIFTDKWWKRHMTRLSRVLNGTTGEVTVDITTIVSFEDVKSVYVEGRRDPLPKVSDTYNATMFSGTSAQFYEASTTTNKLIVVQPITAAANISIVGRKHPGTFVSATVVPFDPWAVTWMTAWQYMSDDGSNPDSAAKFQGLFEKRISQLYKAQTSEPIQLENGLGNIPDRWSEWP